jgi:catechol 2,3-dioxygenase-like lactoylglutathione lyase family enzyme
MADPNETPTDDGFRVEQIDHVELFVPDRYVAAAWYARVLGLRVVPEYEHWAADPGGPLMISSDGGSTKLALFEGRSQGDRPTAGYHLVAFRVSGEAFLRFLTRVPGLDLVDHHGRNVTALLAVDHERAFSIYFNDPYGHRLEVTTYDHDVVRRGRARGSESGRSLEGRTEP